MRIIHWRWASLILGGLLVLFMLLYLAAPFFRRPAVENMQDSPSISMDQGIEEFIRNYWRNPIPLQGTPPTAFTDVEASLNPNACGSCHAEQYRDWQESLHSMAMGPGPWGQILDLGPQDANQCSTCHAPLSEQMPLVVKATAQLREDYVKNPNFDSRLQLRGITCAACHVRRNQRFGPPKAEGAGASRYPSGTPNHGGVQRTPYFERAEFCKDCHQFDPQNTLLVNGKPLQDTFREWKNSTWGKGGASCQECHMPGRRHLWKGIHDPEMVKGGVRVEARINGAPTAPGGPIEVEVQVTNSAVGHKFPTYITPRVFVRAVLMDETGSALPGTQQESVIGRDVRSDTGQWKEYFDTRVSPGESFRQTFKWTRPLQARKVRAWVEVYPDYFYNVHFYPAYLNGGGLSPEGKKLVEKALRESGRTPYILFEKLIPLS